MSAEREFQTLAVKTDKNFLFVTLNRPEVKNAMSFAMVEELEAVCSMAESDDTIRGLVLRGAGNNLCSGGDIKDMATARQNPPEAGQRDPLATANRQFGKLISRFNHLSKAVIVVAEGAILGGGFGLVCVSDIAIASDNARFGLPETSLGITPAQIAPFISQRVGLTSARKLAVMGGKIDSHEALSIGLVHYVEAQDKLEDRLNAVIDAVRLTAPSAQSKTKQLIFDSYHAADLEKVLDAAALDFADCARGEEGVEGLMAFIQKRPAKWTVED